MVVVVVVVEVGSFNPLLLQMMMMMSTPRSNNSSSTCSVLLYCTVLYFSFPGTVVVGWLDGKAGLAIARTHESLNGIRVHFLS